MFVGKISLPSHPPTTNTHLQLDEPQQDSQLSAERPLIPPSYHLNWLVLTSRSRRRPGPVQFRKPLKQRLLLHLPQLSRALQLLQRRRPVSLVHLLLAVALLLHRSDLKAFPMPRQLSSVMLPAPLKALQLNRERMLIKSVPKKQRMTKRSN